MLDDYRDQIKGKLLSPREHFELMLNLTDEEKTERREFFTEFLARYEQRKREKR